MEEGRVYLKVYESGNERLLAVCDHDLLGKKFSDGQLTLEVKAKFYQGTLIRMENLKREIQRATIVNLAGNKVVNFAVKNKFLDKENILTISGIQHAQIVYF